MFQPGATERLPLVSWQLDPNSADQRAAMTALYDGGIRHVDSELEQWFGELERRGLLADTLVIVTADHGENLMDRGRVSGHGRFWNEGIRVPLVVRHPRGLGAGTRVRENVHLGDIVPTVLDVLGLPRDPRLPGHSLFGLLPAERVLIGSQDIGAYVLRGTRKIARGKRRYLALDLAADPLERKGKVLDECPEFDEWTALATDPGQRYPPPLELAPFTPEEAEHLRALGYAGEAEDPAEEEADER
jgi:membrane-anchored protein YejM (alkaline phosphatase superfamily)